MKKRKSKPRSKHPISKIQQPAGNPPGLTSSSPKQSTLSPPASQLRQTRAEFRSYEHHGPIPDARTFLEYRAVREDLPDLIIEEWKKEGQARREAQKKELDIREQAVKGHSRREFAKTVIVGLFAMGMLGIAGWLAYEKQYELTAAIVASPLLIGIIDAFRQGKK